VHRDAHSKVMNDAKLRDVFHGTMAERIDLLEKVIREAESRLDRDVKSTMMAVDHMRGKMKDVRQAWLPAPDPNRRLSAPSSLTPALADVGRAR